MPKKKPTDAQAQATMAGVDGEQTKKLGEADTGAKPKGTGSVEAMTRLPV